MGNMQSMDSNYDSNDFGGDERLKKKHESTLHVVLDPYSGDPFSDVE